MASHLSTLALGSLGARRWEIEWGEYSRKNGGGLPVGGAYVNPPEVAQHDHYLLPRSSEVLLGLEVRLDQLNGGLVVGVRGRLLLGPVHEEALGALEYDVGARDRVAEGLDRVGDGVVEPAPVGGELLVEVAGRRREVDDVALVDVRGHLHNDVLVDLLGLDLEYLHGLVPLVHVGHVPVAHVDYVGPVKVRRGAPRRLAEAEALAAALLVARLEVEHPLLAVVAGRALDVLLAVAVRAFLVADLLGGAARVAVALLAVGELEVAGPAAAALPAHDVPLALAVAGEEVALEVALEDPVGRALALLAADYRVVAVGAGLALVATLAGHVGRADAGAALGLADRGARAIAGPAIGEAVEAGLADVAAAPDYVGLAGALAAELLALEARRAVDVAGARKGPVVVIRRQGEHRVPAEALLRAVYVEVVRAALLYELLRLVELQLLQVIVAVQIYRDHEDVVQPNASARVLLQRYCKVLD
jgi:hypothetical protein